MIPTYNEADNVVIIVSGIATTGLDVDILFVDDNSPDGTGTILDRLASNNPRLKVLHRPGKQGIGSAHKAGIRWAYQEGYSTLVTMDSDLSHSPSDIKRLLVSAEHADVVVGSRFLEANSLEGWVWHRKLLTHIGHLLTRVVLGLPFDCTNAFRRYRIDRIPLGVFQMVESQSYSFFYESLFRIKQNGFRISEIAIKLPARTYGHSKMRLKDVMHSVVFLWQLASQGWFRPASLVFVPAFEGRDTGERAQAEWDVYWSGGGYGGKWLYDLVAQFYRRFIIRPAVDYFLSRAFAPGSKVMHSGCGTGMVDLGVYDRFQIVAFDISPRALTEYARHHGGQATLLQGSVFDIPAEAESFDGIFNLGLMEHFTEDEIARILKEFHRVLRPGGRIVLFWPPEYGLATQVLKLLDFVLRRMLKKDIALYPAELTRVVSRRQIDGYLRSGGFRLEVFYFGLRDMFTHRIIGAVRLDSMDSKSSNFENEQVAVGV